MAVRRPLPLSARVSLEVPTPPTPATAQRSKATRVLRARTVRIANGEGYQLMASSSCSRWPMRQ